MVKKRVVVTGMGVITPIGNNIDEFNASLKEGKHGFVVNDRLDVSDCKYKLAGLVSNFDSSEYIDYRKAKRMDKFSLYALASAKQAINQSKLDIDSVDLTRCGVCIGSGIGGIATTEKECIKVENGGLNKISTMFVPLIIPNMAGANIAINFGFKGKCSCPVVACASGSFAIADAYRDIRNGEADVMIAGGTESPICSVSIAGFAKLHTLSKSEDPDRAMIPFDKERTGFVMGEGAGAVVLEEYEHAVKRGADILAEVVGCGYTCDAFHIVMPDENGEGICAAMKDAINEAGIEAKDINYVNAHGTATELNDISETRAIKNVFKEHAYDMYINSTKSMTGHMIGASGAVEIITCILEMNDKYIHKTAGFKVADEKLDLNYMMESKSNADISYAISNSMGFGGHNVSILLKSIN